jgi:xylulokinase
VRGVIEGQVLSIARHSKWMGARFDEIRATGGAAANREILQVIADVFGADVQRFAVQNSACLGAALRARHAHAVAAGDDISWDDVVRAVVPTADRVKPDPSRHAIYQELMPVHAAREADALGRGPAPAIPPM